MNKPLHIYPDIHYSSVTAERITALGKKMLKDMNDALIKISTPHPSPYDYMGYASKMQLLKEAPPCALFYTGDIIEELESPIRESRFANNGEEEEE